MTARELLRAAGAGVAAGAVGTLAITASMEIERRLRRQEPSTAPAEAAEKVLGVEPETEEGERRLASAVHFAYGTAWGVPRGLLALALPAPAATAAHFGAVWGAALGVVPALRIAPPPWRWGPGEIASSAAHHALYAVATAGALAALRR